MLLKPELAAALHWALRIAVLAYPFAIFRLSHRLRAATRRREEMHLFGFLSLAGVSAWLAWSNSQIAMPAASWNMLCLALLLWFTAWPIVFCPRWIPEKPLLNKSAAALGGITVLAIALVLYPMVRLRGDYRRFNRVELGKGYACETHAFVDMWGGARSFFVVRNISWLPLSRILFEDHAEASETAFNTPGSCTWTKAHQPEILLDFDGRKETIPIE